MSRWAYPSGYADDQCFHGTEKDDKKCQSLSNMKKQKEGDPKLRYFLNNNFLKPSQDRTFKIRKDEKYLIYFHDKDH